MTTKNAATEKSYDGFTEEERGAMKERGPGAQGVQGPRQEG